LCNTASIRKIVAGFVRLQIILWLTGATSNVDGATTTEARPSKAGVAGQLPSLHTRNLSLEDLYGTFNNLLVG
jgi:hypothetical protein